MSTVGLLANYLYASLLNRIQNFTILYFHVKTLGKIDYLKFVVFFTSMFHILGYSTDGLNSTSS